MPMLENYIPVAVAETKYFSCLLEMNSIHSTNSLQRKTKIFYDVRNNSIEFRCHGFNKYVYYSGNIILYPKHEPLEKELSQFPGEFSHLK